MSVKITNPENVLGLEEGDEVVMPDPCLGDDNWQHGGFIGTINKIRPKGGVEMALVLDANDDGFDIELDRLERS